MYDTTHPHYSALMVYSPIKLNDCIRNTTAVCSPRQIQNSVQDKIFSPRQKLRILFQQNFFLIKIVSNKKNFVKKKILRFCLGLNFVSDFQCFFFFELSRTNRCLSLLSGIVYTYIQQFSMVDTSLV